MKINKLVLFLIFWFAYRIQAQTYVQNGPPLQSAFSALTANLGYSVAISGDGSTAIAGAPGYASGAGAVFVFTRNTATNVWAMQGATKGSSPIMPFTEAGAAQAGNAVALNYYGTVAAIAGFQDQQISSNWRKNNVIDKRMSEKRRKTLW